MWAALGTCVLLAASGSPAGLTVQVERAERAEDQAVLDVDQILAALRLRLEPDGVVVKASRFSRASDWRLELVFLEPGQLQLRVLTPGGEVLNASTLATAGRRPRDLAHTIALLAVEALSTGVNAESRPAGPQTPAVPNSTEAHWSWALALAASSEWFIPDPALRWGLQALAVLSRGSLVFDVELAAWLPRTRSGADYVVGTSPSLIRLGAGAQHTLDWARLSAVLGPVARLTVVTASGYEVGFRARPLVDAGVGLRVCAEVRTWVLDLGVCLEVNHFLTWTRLIVDGQGILETGHTISGLALQVAYRAP